MGDLPEPAHLLLEDGDVEPLLRFGSTSGKGMILGLRVFSVKIGDMGPESRAVPAPSQQIAVI